MERQSPFDPAPDDASENPKAFRTQQDSEPRLGIIHLIGWIAFTAVYMSAQQSLLKWVTNADPSVGHSIQHVAWGLGAGMAIGSVFLMIARRRQGNLFPGHPGEFLGVLQGFSVLFSLMGFVILRACALGIGWVPFGIAYFQFFMLQLPELGIAVLFAVWAWRTTRQAHWRVFFFAFALLPIVLFALDFLSSMIWVPPWELTAVMVTVPVLLLLAVLVDNRVGRRRPWTHWMGIGLQYWLWFTEWLLPLLAPI